MKITKQQFYRIIKETIQEELKHELSDLELQDILKQFKILETISDLDSDYNVSPNKTKKKLLINIVQQAIKFAYRKGFSEGMTNKHGDVE